MRFFISGEVDAQVADIFREIRNDIEKRIKTLEVNNYGTDVESIAIIPIIVNLKPELEAAGFFQERRQFSKKKKEADYRLRINFEKFLNADNHVKKMLIIKNIVESVRALSEKVNKNFDSKKLEGDILKGFEISSDEIDKYET